MQEILPETAIKNLGMAVSGGSDSMALAMLAANWAKKKGITFTALTVDHGLRSAATEETKCVKHWLEEWGISTHILTWKGPHPKKGIQEAARDARYQLMANYCEGEKIDDLLLGHQLEDQLETLLMRLSKGSGLEGLAAMQRVSQKGKLRLLRPLLGVRREILRDYLRMQKQQWIDDPSNENPIYTRTRVGSVLKELEQLPGSNLETVALSLRRIQRASQSLEMLARQKIHEVCDISPLGYIRFPLRALEGCPDELALRMLGIVLRCVGGGKRIKLQSLEDLYQRLFMDGIAKSGTLGGAQILKSGKDWLVCREPGRYGLAEIDIEAGDSEWLWDDRFMIIDSTPGKPIPASLHLRALGLKGWAQLKTDGLAPKAQRIPAKVRYSLPALWFGEEMVAAPLLVTDDSDEMSLNRRFHMQFRAIYWMLDPVS